MCHSLHVRPDIESKTVDISLWNYGFAYSDLFVLDKDELNKLIVALEYARGKIA